MSEQLPKLTQAEFDQLVTDLESGKLGEEELRKIIDAAEDEFGARAERRIDFYQPQPKQLLFHRSTARTRALFKGNRSGGTEAMVAEMCWLLEGKHPHKRTPIPPIRSWMIVQILPASRDDHTPQLEKLREFLPRRLLIDGSWDKSWNQSAYTLNLNNGSWVRLKSHEQKDVQFESEKLHFVFYDEPPPRRLWDLARPRLTDLRGDRLLTCTVKRADDMWVKSEIWDRAEQGDGSTFACMMSTWENRFLAPDEKEQMARDIADPDMRKAVMGEGFAVKTGPYFKEFNPLIHVARTRLDPSPRGRLLRGWDIAPLHRISACVWGQLVDGQFRVYDHYCAAEGFRTFVDKVLARSDAEFGDRSFEDWTDPSAFTEMKLDEEAVSCAKIMRARGLSPRKGPMTWMDREDAIRWRLSHMVSGEAGFLLDPYMQCVNPDSGRMENMLVDAFAERFRYNYNSRSQTYDDKPEKNVWSHLVDSISYLPIGQRVDYANLKPCPRYLGKASMPSTERKRRRLTGTAYRSTLARYGVPY